ncbi:MULTISPECIES: restriction endonuclease-like protein [Bacillus]|uniref:restriction endonuclease-like protein n=1 Tax=Bacillus TaxID=1386 RepID=UPI0002FE116A|nr:MULTISPECIES: restriction endonuclease-like protein [Bacillus]
MASLLSGSREEVELVKIDHPDFSLVIKGRPFHERYEGLKQYQSMDQHDVMQFVVNSDEEIVVEVFDVESMALTSSTAVRPIFFENGTYQVMIVPKNGMKLSFYHEHPILRNAISEIELPQMNMLMGNLQFQNEVGLTSFEIRSGNNRLLEVTLEIFPTKLDYKKDYQRLLEEVNDEIYNLAFHFIKKTYLGASIKLDGNPSRAEFYRLISKHFQQFVQAITRIEGQPHHKLEQTYVKVRGDQLSKSDATTRKYLQQRAHVFVEVKQGISIRGKTYMPLEWLKPRKQLTYDTFENRYVKWMMERLIHKLNDLLDALCQSKSRFEDKPDAELVEQLEAMKKTLEGRLKNLFWRKISKLDRSVMSLVLQMAPGYRDAFQIYLTVSKGLVLQGKMYRMSVKDVATLYEYWTFLKLGQILSKKYEQVSQDIVKVNRNGLFVNLEANQSAKRVFKHPITNERIELVYQKYVGKLPTLPQKPDTMLSIQKKGKEYDYNYVFDAKYRVDYANEGSYYANRYKKTGPLEDDINTMHRYRDSIVVENKGPYERTAFGAYVLFPWNDEEDYKDHPFYESIDKVNIGGFPFLPNASKMVEQFIERLIEKSPEELQSEGILPRGSYEEWQSSLVEKVLVGLVVSPDEYVVYSKNGYYRIAAASLKKGWQEAKYVALYVKAGVAHYNGVYEFGEITSVEHEDGYVVFHVMYWNKLKKVIKPIQYGISSYMMTSYSQLQEATELPELYMKSSEETKLWRMLRRVSDRVQVQLDQQEIDAASQVDEFSFRDVKVKILKEENMIYIEKLDERKLIDLQNLDSTPSSVFREILSFG